MVLPKTPFGRLYAADVTPDFKWLAVSGYSRGAVWDLAQDKMVFWLYEDFVAPSSAMTRCSTRTFPRNRRVERTVAHLNLATAKRRRGSRNRKQFSTAAWRVRDSVQSHQEERGLLGKRYDGGPGCDNAIAALVPFFPKSVLVIGWLHAMER